MEDLTARLRETLAVYEQHLPYLDDPDYLQRRAEWVARELLATGPAQSVLLYQSPAPLEISAIYLAVVVPQELANEFRSVSARPNCRPVNTPFNCSSEALTLLMSTRERYVDPLTTSR